MSMPLPPGLEMRTTVSRNLPVAGLGMRARTIDLFQSQTFGRGRKPAHYITQFLQPKVNGGHTFSNIRFQWRR